MRLICEIEGCGEELTEGTGSKGGLMICHNCRSSSYYWKGQGLAAAKERRTKLSLYSARIEYYEPRVLKAMNNARRAVAAAKHRAQSHVNAH